VAVAVEEFAVGQGRGGVQGLARERLAADGDDAAGGDFGTLAGDAVGAAIEGEEGIACVPRHQIARDVHAGVLPTHPAVRDTVLVEGKDQWMVAHLIESPIEPNLADRNDF
jgi:DNA-binding transcriptional LysR family regulator